MKYDYNNFPPAGIDMGTSNSVLAVYENRVNFKGARAINLTSNSPVGPLLASAVLLEEDEDGDQLIVGSIAEKYRISHPEMFASAFKRKIGDNTKNIKLGDNFFSAIDLSKQVLKKLFSEKISQDQQFNPPGVVVSIPYNFTHIQKKNTKLAAELAINETFSKYEESERPKFLGLLPEPVAAAIYYTYINKKTILNDHIVLIFDFGGGTIDLTICKINITQKEIRFEVLATDGCERFGGEDIDDLLVGYLRTTFKEELNHSRLDERLKRMLDQQIRDIAKSAKEGLSINKSTQIIASLKNGKTIDSTFKQKDLELLLKGGNYLNRDMGGELKNILDRLFDDAKIQSNSVNKVLLVGGSSKIPYFQKILRLKCKNAELIMDSSMVDTGVAKGTAIYASYLLDKEHENIHKAFDKDLSHSKFLFRISNSMGVKTNGDKMEVLIKTNSIAPAIASKIFYFRGYKDHSKQKVATKIIEVYQGEHSLVTGNTLIGNIELPNIYTHGRQLKEIPVKIIFKADENFVEVEINIPKGNKDETDIMLKNRLKI